MNYQELGIVTKNYRNRSRISQVDFAGSVGISRNYLSMIELGKVNNLSVEILVKLAGRMEVSPTYLLSILLGETRTRIRTWLPFDKAPFDGTPLDRLGMRQGSLRTKRSVWPGEQ